MNTLFRAALGAMMLLACLGSANAAERSWDSGSVWNITYVETHPGKFNDYIGDLRSVWRQFLDAQKADGLVLSYKMLSVAAPRDGEPDLILMVEYKNWAAFDRGVEYFEALSTKIMGSMDATQQANVQRGELRTIRSQVIAQELTFK
ncbi:hypothetical protein [Ferrimonas balearica]|uniref:hypothetical protein n=1 Tax=Ferrimonas balearica TaxID=44012 RepID=UPI001C99FE79|nr:hypothetical protein [Ferrimonas balearica]MBY5993942.1 hypothetical protein [Ferrimonas balearica]